MSKCLICDEANAITTFFVDVSGIKLKIILRSSFFFFEGRSCSRLKTLAHMRNEYINEYHLVHLFRLGLTSRMRNLVNFCDTFALPKIVFFSIHFCFRFITYRFFEALPLDFLPRFSSLRKQVFAEC